MESDFLLPMANGWLGFKLIDRNWSLRGGESNMLQRLLTLRALRTSVVRRNLAFNSLRSFSAMPDGVDLQDDSDSVEFSKKIHPQVFPEKEHIDTRSLDEQREAERLAYEKKIVCLSASYGLYSNSDEPVDSQLHHCFDTGGDVSARHTPRHNKTIQQTNHRNKRGSKHEHEKVRDRNRRLGVGRETGEGGGGAWRGVKE